MTGDLVIAVDGGGTSSRARVYDPAGRVLGEGASEPGNIRIGLAQAWRNIGAAIDAGLEQAGLPPSALGEASLVLGLAGIVNDADAEAVLATAPRTARAVAVSDAHIACLGAFGGGDGAIFISGTGSAAYAIVGGQGRPLFGWGFELDDKGSAAGLGRAALIAALEAHDGLADRSPLTEALWQQLGGEAGAIVHWVNTALPRDYGALAPLVFDAARREDPVGVALLTQSASQVDRMVARLCEIGAPAICLMGGMARHIAPWLSAPTTASLAPAQADALMGAFLLARASDRAGDD